MWKIWRPALCAGICVALAHCTAPEDGSEPPGQPGAGPNQSAEAGAPGTPGPERSFAEIDVDDDGFLSREEVRTEPALRNIFALADRDQDGKLNVPEYSHATIEGTTVSADAAQGPLFLALDEDENRRITPDEAQAVPQLEQSFATYDVDGDGALDVEEYNDARAEGLTPSDDESGSGP